MKHGPRTIARRRVLALLAQVLHPDRVAQLGHGDENRHGPAQAAPRRRGALVPTWFGKSEVAQRISAKTTS